MRYTILTIIAFIGLASCQPKQKTIELTSTIDSTLQIKATSILENKLTELNALSGQTIALHSAPVLLPAQCQGRGPVRAHAHHRG